MLSNGEGFLMGIINGFGSMANRYIEDEAAVEKQRKLEEIKAQIREQEMRTQKELELEYAPQKAKVEAGIEEDARQKRVGIVDAALEDRAVDAVQKKYADPVMGDTPLTDEQQSVLNEGMAKNVREREGTRQGILASNKERMLAERDAGYKMDPTAVNADNRDEMNTYREAQLAKQMADSKTRAEREAQNAEERRRSNQENESLRADKLRLEREKADTRSATQFDGPIVAAMNAVDKAKDTLEKRIAADPMIAKKEQALATALETDKDLQAARKHLDDLRERQRKAFEEKAKAPEPTPSGIATPVTQADYDALPSGASYFKGGKIYKKR